MSPNASASLLRTINRSAILELIRNNSPISRTQIGNKLNISLPTVMRIIDDLIAEQLVRETGTQTPSRGRPPSLLEFNSEAFAIIGVDLGGTKIYGMVADLAGNIQHSLYKTHEDNIENANGNYLETVCQFIERLLEAPRPADQQIRGIGVGAPGITLVPDGVVTWAPSLGWRDLPLQDILTERFDLPVTVENDVNLAALGEWGFGLGKNSSSMVTINLGTGIGAGIVIDGSIHRGFNQAAGEVGYMLPGIQFLGNKYTGFGALETIASGTGIADRACQYLQENNLPLPLEKLDSRYVFSQAELGIPWAQRILDETINYIALAIANISTVLDPEVVILGGGVANSGKLLLEPIKARIAKTIPFIPRIEISQLGREAVVMGAIMHVMKATDKYVIVKQFE